MSWCRLFFKMLSQNEELGSNTLPMQMEFVVLEQREVSSFLPIERIGQSFAFRRQIPAKAESWTL